MRRRSHERSSLEARSTAAADPRTQSLVDAYLRANSATPGDREYALAAAPGEIQVRHGPTRRWSGPRPVAWYACSHVHGVGRSRSPSAVGRHVVMRELTLTIALLFAVSCASARAPGLLTVRVIDERCGFPLPGATVTVTRGSETRSKTIDAHGDAMFSVLPGVWQVEPSLAGSFNAQVESTRVEAATETRLEVWLNLVNPDSMAVEPHGHCRPRTRVRPNSVAEDASRAIVLVNW